MRRLALSLLPVLLLAACAGAPQKSARGSGGVVVANGAYRAPPPGFPHFVDRSIGREEISIQAMGLVGVPYRWGGNTPDSGFDCSGLVRYVVLRAASVNLPRTTAEMSGRGESIEPDGIAPGDLIFFNTTGRAHSHVGIYVGKLRFVNAPSTGGTVRLDYLTNPYWAKRFDGIRRVAGPAATPTPFDAPSYQAAAPGAATSVAAGSPGSSGDVGAAGVTGAAGMASATAPMAKAAAQAPLYAGESAQTARGDFASRPPPTTAAQATFIPTTALTAAQAEQFESSPPGLSAAQLQARSAGTVSPVVAPSAQASMYEAGSPAAQRTQPVAPASLTGRTATPAGATATTGTSAPDAIDAAADAFEPPPPAAVAARQAQQAQQAPQGESGNGVQLMRASTTSRGIAAPTHTSDDPIARFANGGY
ncbi:NlpC/P60 family protein [Paraburkholderia sp. MMS20-SJTR3]|uniref:NlpC/P60 family protein n=1 Tax=Paraburkholderia sejongensis TaxID=2886946 RepID=A0ABS8JN75_9BURK|nr:C40 family peptidase [Paraburkholderia sp. MMS20-SJTR3]MCC8391297.1 NlpC/P60 family protein [Paraburkholderia sp. MMS20-SJTR3]